MSKVVPFAKRVPAALLAAILLGALFFLLGLWAFQPFAGPVEMVARASRLELLLATAFGLVVGGVAAWRVLRSGSVRAELRRAADVLGGENES
jgi:hypothetical protein